MNLVVTQMPPTAREQERVLDPIISRREHAGHDGQPLLRGDLGDRRGPRPVQRLGNRPQRHAETGHRGLGEHRELGTPRRGACGELRHLVQVGLRVGGRRELAQRDPHGMTPICSRVHGLGSVSVRRRFLLLSIILVTGLAGACTGTPTPSASGRSDNTAMVLAEPVEPTSLNPLSGYAPNGSAKIFDGLYEHQTDGTLRPTLASAAPVPSADGKSWTVTLRTGIRFSDGTPFAAVDVLATYRALINPAFAAPVRADYSMLTGVDEVGPSTIRFDLAYPYAPFPDRLVLGIVAAPSLATVEPVSQLPTAVGTGPYTLVSWTKGSQLTLAANPLYPTVLGGPPKVKKVVVQFVPNDTDRAARLRAGKLDGAALAPTQAATFAHTDGFSVLTDHSADLRAVQLPAHGPVTGDPAIRLALNHAVDRGALVSGPLSGAGTPAATPMPAALPEFVEPSATFTTSQDQARTALLQAGWIANTDGGRSKEGVPAAFTLDYPAGDAVDKALASAFATDASAIGIT